MRAIVQKGYGAPDVLALEDVDRPLPAGDEVLVRVHAASVNVLDWRKMRASPVVIRMTEGFARPKQPILGVDAAGVVEAVGKDVTHLRPGDEVFGIGKGSLAEYTIGKTFAPKPTNFTFEEAAAMPVAGSTALQAIRDIGKVEAAQRILVNGAGGGVGHVVAQVAKAFDADVTATTTSDKLKHVQSLGVGRVIDYTKEDFRDSGETYDVIFEVGGGLTLRRCRPSLAPDGRLIYVGAGAGLGGPIGRFVSASFQAKVLRQPVVAFVSWESVQDLMTLKALAESKKIKPVIHRTYELANSAQAVAFLETGAVQGKVVITV